MTDTSGYDYEGAALEGLRESIEVTDRFDADRHVARAAVYADLHRTRIMERSLGEDVAVSPFVKPAWSADRVLEEGAPEGWRWAKYEEILAPLDSTKFGGPSRADVEKFTDTLANAGVHIVVEVGS